MPEQLKTIDEIASELRGETGTSPSLQKKALPSFKKDTNKIQDITYNVPHSTIYDRLNDGTYVAKFENYAGAVGNEDRLANEQTWYEQIGNGLLKNVRKAGNYALDATVGTVAGLFNSIQTGSFSGFYDNDFSKTLDDWNTQLDYSLPNYYSDEQKSKGLLGSMGTANFWFNDVAGGLAFVGGSLLPEIAIGALSGGSTLPGSLAKFGLKTTGKSLLKGTLGPNSFVNGAKIFNKLNDFKAFDDGVDLLRGFERAKYLSKAGNAISTGAFLARTSGFEAGMEARHNFKDAMSEFFESFEEKNGRQPTFEEIQEFSQKAQNASNALFTSNLAILGVSNAVMFGNLLNIKTPSILKSAENFGNRIIGVGTKKLDDATLAVQQANRAQKILGNTYKILEKPLVEGLYEEGFQGVASKSMQNYLRAQYDPEQKNSYGMWAALTDAFAEQYGSKEGWKEMGIGMIIGFAGGGLSSKASGGSFIEGIPGLGKNSRSAAVKKLTDEVDYANRGVEVLRNMNRTSSIRNFRNIIDEKNSRFESTAVENSVMNAQFIKTQEHIKTPSQIQTDFNTIVDNMKMDDASISAIGEENIDTYKQSLKDEFKRSSDDYRFAKNSIEALKLESTLKNFQNGDINEIKDALTMNLYMGKQSLNAARNISDQIQKVTGQDGVFDVMQFYNNLSDSKKKLVGEVRSKQKRLKSLEEKAIEYGTKIAKQQPSSKEGSGNKKLQAKYNSQAEKLVVTQQEISKIQRELQDIENVFKADIRSVGKDIDESNYTNNLIDVSSVISTIDQIDTYADSLRSVGKSHEADSLDYLTKQFKIYSDSHREMTNMTRRMLDSNFFSSKEGSGILDLIVGNKYKMSDEMKAALIDNDEIVDRSLELNGIRGYENAQQYVQTVLEENPELSQRERFKIESILRIQLGVQALQKQVEDINKSEVTIDSEPEISPSPLNEDTVVLKQRLDIENDSLNNIDVLNETINKITSQIDYIRNSSFIGSENLRRQDEINRLSTAENEFIQQGLEPEFEAGEYDKLDTLAERIRNGDPGITAPEEIQLATNYPNLLERLVAGEDNPLKGLAERISSLQNDIDNSQVGFKIIDSDEYLRLNELILKKEASDLTEREAEELSDLEDDVNQWLLITGTVAEGLRLSDLIRQKIILETTPIQVLPDVQNPLPQDVLDGVDFGDRTGSANYSLGQTYDSVTAIGDSKTGSIAISGITPDALIQEVGFRFDFEMNERGNILISPGVKDLINSQSNISILPTNKDLTTNYSIIIKHSQNINGENKSFPLKSNYSEDFSETQDVDAIYRQRPGDKLILEIDPKDQYNQQLISEYFSSLGTSGKTEEELNDLAVSLSQKYIDEDLSLQTMKKEEQILKKQIETAATTSLQSDIRKRLLKLQNKIDRQEDKLTQKAEKDAFSPSPINEKKVQESIFNLKKGAVIRVKDAQGNFLAVLKGKTSSGVKNPQDSKFEALRDQILEQPGLIEQIASTGLSEEFEIPNLSVKKVFIGHPNFNFIKNPDSTVGIEYKKLTEQDARKIIDIGFIQNGSLNTRSRVTGIDTTFLRKFIKTAQTGEKIPFIVFEKEGLRIGYPVRMNRKENPDNKEFIDTFNSNASDVNKVASLNKILAQRGVDIKEPGNAFISVGEGNLNQDFFDQKLRQLEDMEYYSDPSYWMDPSFDIQNVLLNDLSINIDLSNPVHSPKLQIDFENSPVEISTEVLTPEQKESNRKTTPEKSILHSILGKEIDDSAKDELNEDC